MSRQHSRFNYGPGFYSTRDQDEIQSVTFSPNGEMIAVGGSRDMQLLRIEGNSLLDEPLINSSVASNSVAFSPDDKILASGGEDGTIRLWDASTGEAIGEPLRGHEKGYSGVRSVAFSPDGKTLASAGSDMTVRLWDVDYAIEIAELNFLEPVQVSSELSVEELLQKACDQLRFHSELKWQDFSNDFVRTDEFFAKKAALVCKHDVVQSRVAPFMIRN